MRPRWIVLLAAASAVLVGVITFLIARPAPPTPSPVESPSVAITPTASPRSTTDHGRTPYPTSSEVDAARGQPDRLTTQEQKNPKAVARTVAETVSNVDTTTDTSWRDARERASYLFTDELTQNATVALPVGNPGADWLQWSEDRAYITAELEEAEDGELPEGTNVQKFYAFNVWPQLHGSEHEPPTPHVLYVTLVREAPDGPWRADDLQQTDDMEWGHDH